MFLKGRIYNFILETQRLLETRRFFKFTQRNSLKTERFSVLYWQLGSVYLSNIWAYFHDLILAVIIGENGTTFWAVPLFSEIFQSGEPKKRFPFTQNRNFQNFWPNGKRYSARFRSIIVKYCVADKAHCTNWWHMLRHIKCTIKLGAQVPDRFGLTNVMISHQYVAHIHFG